MFRSSSGSEQGFTIIEVLISAILVALIAAALAQQLIGSAVSTGDQRTRSLAAQLAQQDQERLRGFSATQLTALNQTRTVTLNGTAFSVTSTASYIDSTGASSCTSANAAYYKTTSSVTWSSNPRSPVVEESDITPPPGGMLLVQTVDQTNAPLAGIGITASGPDYATGTTSSAGCTLMSDLATGSYTVAFNAPGYIDANGNASPTLPSSVTGTGISYPSVHPEQLARAGNVTANFTTTATGNTISCPGSAGTCSSQSTDAVTWFGSGSSNSMSADKSSTLTSPGKVIPATGSIALFPFYFTAGNYTNNYQMWPGKCAQNEPPSGVDKLTVSPGSSQTASLQEPALKVIVQTPTGVNNTWARATPAHVKLTFQSATGPACSDSYFVPIVSDAATDTNGVLANLGQPFATTATTGTTASASGYTGTYTACADLFSNGDNYFVNVTGIQNNNYTTPTTVTLQVDTTNSNQRGTC